MDGKHGLALGGELGAGLEASERDGKPGLALGRELGAGLEASWMDGKLGLGMEKELGVGLEAIVRMLDGMSGDKRFVLYLNSTNTIAEER